MCFDTEKRDEIEHSAEIRSDVRPSYINAKFLSLAISLHNLIQCQKYLQDLFWAFHNKVFLKFKWTHFFHREERILNEPCFWKLDRLGTCCNFFLNLKNNFQLFSNDQAVRKKFNHQKWFRWSKKGLLINKIPRLLVGKIWSSHHQRTSEIKSNFRSTIYRERELIFKYF